MLQGRYGQLDQAGDTSPHTGEQSQLILANLGALTVTPQTVIGAHAYTNYLGELPDPTGLDEMLVTGSSANYRGIAPAHTQPTTSRVPPWL